MGIFHIQSYYNIRSGKNLKDLTDCELDIGQRTIKLVSPATRLNRLILVDAIANISYDEKNGFVSISMRVELYPIMLRCKDALDAKSIAYAIRNKTKWVMLGSTYGLGTTENRYHRAMENHSLAHDHVVDDDECRERAIVKEEDLMRDARQAKNKNGSRNTKGAEASKAPRDESSNQIPTTPQSMDEDPLLPRKRRRLLGTERPNMLHDLLEQFDGCRESLAQAMEQSKAQDDESEVLRSQVLSLQKELEEKKAEIRRNSKEQSKVREVHSKLLAQTEELSSHIRKVEQQSSELAASRSQKEKLQGEVDALKSEQTKSNVELSTAKAHGVNLQNEVDWLKDLFGMCVCVVDPDKFLAEMKGGSTVADAHLAAIRKN
ncbi:hypothetical protein ABEF95_005745 [Exophiala dermatitidis]